MPPFNLCERVSICGVIVGDPTGDKLSIDDEGDWGEDVEGDEIMSFLKASRTWRSGINGFFLPSCESAYFQSLSGCNSIDMV